MDVSRMTIREQMQFPLREFLRLKLVILNLATYSEVLNLGKNTKFQLNV